MKHLILAILFAVIAQAGMARGVSGTFSSIDGGSLSIEDWRGQPVLVVNTASQCGFTGQYTDLQILYDQYRDQGLVVLAVPSDDFNQELATASEVKEFCELNYDLDLPMTDISNVKGANAHPFYKAVRKESGFEPTWNFNKVLIAPDGSVLATWGSTVKPTSRKIKREIEALLN
ncbi:glutathione peroxidase [Sedimentitalea todarodis]|uniref:Glutathione peroxidase n=1 Tax=Sedimentitalea todarodis TaxID=1631240 RepID=A0ABU3VA36_9RHOB|nr:glutathione peroxidase [Sedimentitalea todarodis]MDU9003017.1 glutathione peroxidase [Sedimentitalea todarodis]